MTFIILNHPASHGHITPTGHPERVERIAAVEKALSASGFAAVPRIEAPDVADAALRLAHPQSYLDHIATSEPAEGFASLDPDTHMASGSYQAARRGAGAVVRAVDMVMGGEAKIGFSAMRPPGHHAEKTTAMGFCFFANIAIGALHAIEAHGAARVAVADFDVHHGNGTQDVVWDEPRITFCSSHQLPLYPGTGAEHETGAGNIFNAGLPPESGSAAFRAAWEDRLLPAIDAAKPDLILISAGFDAHRDDPLANLMLDEEDFAWITGRLCDLAATHCGGRVVSALEGGYDLPSLAASTAAHCKVLMERAG